MSDLEELEELALECPPALPARRQTNAMIKHRKAYIAAVNAKEKRRAGPGGKAHNRADAKLRKF